MNKVQIVSRKDSEDSLAFIQMFCLSDQYAHAYPRPQQAPDASYVQQFFQNQEQAAEFWVAKAGERVVGRIAAACSAGRREVGYIGLFDIEGDASFSLGCELIARALSWLSNHGVEQVYGPVDFNIWNRYRFCTKYDPNTDGKFVWEPQNPAVYLDYFKEAGFTTAATYHSVGFASTDFEPALRQLRPFYEDAERNGFSFRTLANSGSALKTDVSLLYKIASQCFAGGFLYEPIAEEKFAGLYEPLLQRRDTRLSRFILDQDGREQGFLFCFIDQNYAVVKTVAVLPELLQKAKYKRFASSNALLYLALSEGFTYRLKGAVSALVRQDASSVYMERKQTWAECWRNEYAVLERKVVAK